MVNNVYDLVTRTMEQEFPGRVAFRWVEDATGTVKEKTYAEYAQDIRRAAAWFARNIPEVEGKRVVLLSRNCYEYGVNTFGAVLAGAVLVTMNQKKTWPFKGWALNLCSDLRNFYRDLGLMHSDSIAVAPVLMESIYKDVKRGRADKLNGLWNPCGSSAMFDSEMLLGLVENGMYITQCYGMTETCGDGLVNYAQAEPHIRALGKPDGHCEYKLDETGEICIRGGCVMLGYYKDPEATAEIIDKDGWLHTGDLAREDEEGYYYMVGRKKNLIILGTGENVSPEELERKLNACPEVQECVVKEMGKKIGALICCAEEKQAEVRAFITGLNRTLPLYQRITAVEFSTEPLPRNAMGKLLRR